ISSLGESAEALSIGLMLKARDALGLMASAKSGSKQLPKVKKGRGPRRPIVLLGKYTRSESFLHSIAPTSSLSVSLLAALANIPSILTPSSPVSCNALSKCLLTENAIVEPSKFRLRTRLLQRIGPFSVAARTVGDRVVHVCFPGFIAARS